MANNLIDLKKKAKISLEKVNIFGEKANIVLVLDISVSMRTLYQNGTVQRVVERMLGIGLNMDEDKKIDIYTFGENSHENTSASEQNIDGYVQKILMKEISLEYDTKYAGVMKKIIKRTEQNTNAFTKLFQRNKSEKFDPSVPTFVFFITDGTNNDTKETENLIREASKYPVFWQFVGIGGGKFPFLKKLDKMQGRIVDNANFFPISDIDKESDSELYDKLLHEFPGWLKEAREMGIVK